MQHRQWLPLFSALGADDSVKQWQQLSARSSFSEEHQNAYIYLVTDMKLSPAKAIEELSQLNKHQANLLDTLYEDGLRGADLRAWQPPADERHGHPRFSKVHAEAVLTLVRDRDETPQQALRRINGLQSDEVRERFLDRRLQRQF